MNYKSIFIISALLIGCCFFLSAQVTQETEAEIYEKEYNRRIKKSRINGIYIPKNLEDAFVELEAKSEPKSLSSFKREEEKEVCRKLHFGLGKWIFVNWGLEAGSRFGHYLKSFGLSHPDDMIQYTMRAFHKKLNGQPIDHQLLADEFIERRKEEHDEKLKKNTISETKRIRTPNK